MLESEIHMGTNLPDNRAWRVCTQHSTAAWWQHEHCTPSLLWSSSSCSAIGRWGASPTPPFPAPPPLPGLLQGALSGDKTKPYNLAITYLFTATGWIHAIQSTYLLSGRWLIRPVLNLKPLCALNVKNIVCIILTSDFSSINKLAVKSDLIHPQWWQFPPVTCKTCSMNRSLFIQLLKCLRALITIK